MTNTWNLIKKLNVGNMYNQYLLVEEKEGTSLISEVMIIFIFGALISDGLR